MENIKGLLLGAEELKQQGYLRKDCIYYFQILNQAIYHLIMAKSIFAKNDDIGKTLDLGERVCLRKIASYFFRLENEYRKRLESGDTNLAPDKIELVSRLRKELAYLSETEFNYIDWGKKYKKQVCVIFVNGLNGSKKIESFRDCDILASALKEVRVTLFSEIFNLDTVSIESLYAENFAWDSAPIALTSIAREYQTP